MHKCTSVTFIVNNACTSLPAHFIYHRGTWREKKKMIVEGVSTSLTVSVTVLSHHFKVRDELTFIHQKDNLQNCTSISILRADTKNDKWAQQPFTKCIFFRCSWKWVSSQKKKLKKWPGTKMLFCPRGNTLHLFQRHICIPLSLRASLTHPAHSVTLSPSNSC